MAQRDSGRHGRLVRSYRAAHREAQTLVLAGLLMTRVPLPFTGTAKPEELAAALRYLPAFGIMIGSVGAAVLVASAEIFPWPLAVLISIVAACVLTGGLHEDGLADTLDGVGGGNDPERVLAIMQDSRIGTYGTLGLGLTLAIKVFALSAMPIAVAVMALMAAHATSRLSILGVITTSTYVRPVGTARFTVMGISPLSIGFAIVTGALVMAAYGVINGLGPVLAGLCGVVLGHLVARSIFERRLGGYTGDCLGAVQQLSEVGFYLGVLTWL